MIILYLILTLILNTPHVHAPMLGVCKANSCAMAKLSEYEVVLADLRARNCKILDKVFDGEDYLFFVSCPVEYST
jgi:hypothetical protein